MKRKGFSRLLLILMMVFVVAYNSVVADSSGDDPVPANGQYNFKFADTELRHNFMAQAENYLLQKIYGGIPVFANSSFQMFAGRLQPLSGEYVPLMGFGNLYGQLTEDDSTVIMDDGQPGKPGEYTYRMADISSISQFNQWLFQGSNESDRMEWFYDSPYDFHFNDDLTGYQLVPSMAADNPQPIKSHILPTGKEVSRVWRITFRDDFEWVFHPATDAAGLSTTFDANDFYQTYKMALEKQWFRAISGGGDFLSGTTVIEKAEEFVNGTAEWEEVGIKLIDDYTLEFTFAEIQSEWNVRYFMGSFVMTPIHLGLYERVGDRYGTDAHLVAYHGPFYVEYFEADKILRYKRNEQFHNPDLVSGFTGMNVLFIEDSEMRFKEFEDGKLDWTYIPSGKIAEYRNHPSVKREPGATTFRIMINGLETVEKQRKKFPDGYWVPEPILANQNFRLAMYHAIDRQRLAVDVVKTPDPQAYHFTDLYLVDPEEGIAYRDTEWGKGVAAGMSPATYGYNVDAAKAYYREALRETIDAGFYRAGDTIEMSLLIFSGSEGQALFGDFIKQTFEETFNDPATGIKVVIEVEPTEFPAIYDNHMEIGEFDLSIGGIRGGTLNASSFLAQYRSDNLGGFAYNWGYDTNIPEIEVAYTDYDGVLVKELWSFDAIHQALQGPAEVKDGALVKEELVED